MRKWICCVLMLAFIAIPLSALAAKVDKKHFKTAKEALSLISYGEYKKALKKLGLATEKDDVKKLKTLVEDKLNTALYGDVQTDVAVGYETSKGFKLAVPLESPDMGNVETFIVLIKTNQVIGGYQAMCWDDVLAEVEKSDSVVWREPYEPARTIIVADD